jgi:hypothetical protein
MVNIIKRTIELEASLQKRDGAMALQTKRADGRVRWGGFVALVVAVVNNRKRRNSPSRPSPLLCSAGANFFVFSSTASSSLFLTIVAHKSDTFGPETIAVFR